MSSSQEHGNVDMVGYDINGDGKIDFVGLVNSETGEVDQLFEIDDFEAKYGKEITANDFSDSSTATIDEKADSKRDTESHSRRAHTRFATRESLDIPDMMRFSLLNVDAAQNTKVSGKRMNWHGSTRHDDPKINKINSSSQLSDISKEVSAKSASSMLPPPGLSSPRHDTSEASRIRTIEIDSTGDGCADMVGYDFTGDGSPDYIGFVNANNVVDAVMPIDSFETLHGSVSNMARGIVDIAKCADEPQRVSVVGIKDAKNEIASPRSKPKTKVAGSSAIESIDPSQSVTVTLPGQRVDSLISMSSLAVDLDPEKLDPYSNADRRKRGDYLVHPHDPSIRRHLSNSTFSDLSLEDLCRPTTARPSMILRGSTKACRASREDTLRSDVSNDQETSKHVAAAADGILLREVSISLERDDKSTFEQHVAAIPHARIPFENSMHSEQTTIHVPILDTLLSNPECIGESPSMKARRASVVARQDEDPFSSAMQRRHSAIERSDRATASTRATITKSFETFLQPLRASHWGATISSNHLPSRPNARIIRSSSAIGNTFDCSEDARPLLADEMRSGSVISVGDASSRTRPEIISPNRDATNACRRADVDARPISLGDSDDASHARRPTSKPAHGIATSSVARVSKIPVKDEGVRCVTHVGEDKRTNILNLRRLRTRIESERQRRRNLRLRRSMLQSHEILTDATRSRDAKSTVTYRPLEHGSIDVLRAKVRTLRRRAERFEKIARFYRCRKVEVIEQIISDVTSLLRLTCGVEK